MKELLTNFFAALLAFIVIILMIAFVIGVVLLLLLGLGMGLSAILYPVLCLLQHFGIIAA